MNLNEGMFVSAQYKGREGVWIWRERQGNKVPDLNIVVRRNIAKLQSFIKVTKIVENFIVLLEVFYIFYLQTFIRRL